MIQLKRVSRFNSNANLSGIDETRGYITVEEGDLPVGDRNLDRGTHAHHITSLNYGGKWQYIPDSTRILQFVLIFLHMCFQAPLLLHSFEFSRFQKLWINEEFHILCKFISSFSR